MSILHMSISAAILILVIVGVRALVIHRLPKKTFLVLWALVLIRLLVPFAIPITSNTHIPFSAQAIMDRAAELIATPASTQTVTILETAETQTMPTIPTIPTPPIAPITMENVYIWESGVTMSESVASGATMSDVATSEVEAFVSYHLEVPPVIIIWVVGMIGLGLFFMIIHLRRRREYKTALPLENDYIDELLQEQKLRRSVQVKVLDKINSPMTYGILRPVILFPKNTDWQDKAQLQYVLAHEITHIKRFDIVTKWLLAVALCIHWFNPLMWVMYILANRDIEAACDEAVVWTFGETTKSTYALALIGLEESRHTFSPMFNSFAENSIKKRIDAIMKLKKRSVWSMALAVALISAAVVGTLLVSANTNGSSTDDDTRAYELATDTIGQNNNASAIPPGELIDGVPAPAVTVITRDEAANLYFPNIIGQEVRLEMDREFDHHIDPVIDFITVPFYTCDEMQHFIVWICNTSDYYYSVVLTNANGQPFEYVVPPESVIVIITYNSDGWTSGRHTVSIMTTAEGFGNALAGHVEILVSKTLGNIMPYEVGDGESVVVTEIISPFYYDFTIDRGTEQEIYDRLNDDKADVLRNILHAEETQAQSIVRGTGDLTWPVVPENPATVVRPFGSRMHPVLRVMRNHSGIDIAAPHGATVVAADRGTVLISAYNYSFGNYIVIAHGENNNGDRIVTLYAQLQSSGVMVGDVVERGQVIGYVGSSGTATGPHLHFEVILNGARVDPLSVLQPGAGAVQGESATIIETSHSHNTFGRIHINAETFPTATAVVNNGMIFGGTIVEITESSDNGRVFASFQDGLSPAYRSAWIADHKFNILQGESVELTIEEQARIGQQAEFAQRAQAEHRFYQIQSAGIDELQMLVADPDPALAAVAYRLLQLRTSPMAIVYQDVALTEFSLRGTSDIVKLSVMMHSPTSPDPTPLTGTEEIEWRSSDTSIFTVTSLGGAEVQIEAVGFGVAYLSVFVDGAPAEIAVRVMQVR